MRCIQPAITRNSRKHDENTKMKKLVELDTFRTLPRPPTQKITKINEMHEKGDRDGGGKSIKPSPNFHPIGSFITLNLCASLESV